MSQVKCSFCGKASDDVLKIIAGPGVYMCDECVILSMSILLDSPVSSGQIEVFTDEEVIRKALKYDKKPGISWCKACRSFMFDLRSDKTPNVFVEHQCFKMLEDEKKTTRTLNTDIPKTDKSQLILKKRIESILPQFSEKEAKIISLRLGSDDRSPKTLDEVAELLDIEKDEILDLERLLLFKLHGQQ